jgi:hypothetical protein
MTKLFQTIHNITTGEIQEIELTAEEVAEHNARQEKAKADRAERLAAEAKAEADKEAAKSKLAALGLTTDDLKALGL